MDKINKVVKFTFKAIQLIQHKIIYFINLISEYSCVYRIIYLQFKKYGITNLVSSIYYCLKKDNWLYIF